VHAERPRAECAHVLRKRLPLPRHAGVHALERHALHVLEHAQQELTVARAPRREGEAAVADHDRCDPVPARRRAEPIPRRLRVVVARARTAWNAPATDAGEGSKPRPPGGLNECLFLCTCKCTVDRYLNVTEPRRRLLDLVGELHGGDRIVITKHGRPRAVLVDSERYALLEDLAWVLEDAGRRQALQLAWDEYRRGEVLRPPKGAPPTVQTLRRMAKLPRRRAEG